LWKDIGSPRSGVVADIRTQCRAKYHYVLRKIRKNKENIEADRLAQALLVHDDHTFFSTVNKIRGKKVSLASKVDGVEGKEAIGNVFASKASVLYNIVSYDQTEMDSLSRAMDQDVICKCVNGKCYHSHNVSVHDICFAVKSLKKGKSDGNNDQTTDHLIYGSQRLFTYLALLFTSMIHHSFSPQEFLLSTIIPIPKSKRKSIGDSENYRGIALSSVLCKLIDNVILNTNKHIFQTSDMQFGFKPKHSTTQCTFVFNEVVNYYNHNGSDVYTMLLDASKAFDRVEYVKLFKLLLAKGICPLLARFLAKMYMNQSMRIKWSDFHSNSHTVTNGVKQGGVISPLLFTVYIDELILRLKNAGIGCHIGNVFAGVFGYADDLSLLAPTKHALKVMLQICTDFSKEYSVLFNPTKSKFIIFGANGCNAAGSITFEGKELHSVSKDIHLGNVFGPNANKDVIAKCKAEFYQRVNLTIATFHKARSWVKYKLFKTFCMSIYGSVLWDFSTRECEQFYTAWRKCVRRVWGISPCTHNRLLAEISQDQYVAIQLHK
jgi:hypothetical protein